MPATLTSIVPDSYWLPFIRFAVMTSVIPDLRLQLFSREMGQHTFVFTRHRGPILEDQRVVIRGGHEIQLCLLLALFDPCGHRGGDLSRHRHHKPHIRTSCDLLKPFTVKGADWSAA